MGERAQKMIIKVNIAEIRETQRTFEDCTIAYRIDVSGARERVRGLSQGGHWVGEDSVLFREKFEQLTQGAGTGQVVNNINSNTQRVLVEMERYASLLNETANNYRSAQNYAIACAKEIPS